MSEVCSPRRFSSGGNWNVQADPLQPVIRMRLDTEQVRNEMVALAGTQEGHVDVHGLDKYGFTTEDLSRVIYDKFRETDLPDFLDFVELEKKGGLGRIGTIWCPQKYLSFAFIVFSVIFNVSYLIAMDWAIFRCFAQNVVERFEGVDLTSMTDVYLTLVEANGPTAELFKSRLMDAQTRLALLNIAVLVATWEVCWIMVNCAYSIYIWLMFICGTSEYRSFREIMHFFQRLLPQFSTFSAIKLMAKVHPSLIYNEYVHVLNESSLRATRYGQVCVLLCFALKCTFCASAALGAFTIKLLTVSLKLMNPSCWIVTRMGAVLALLLQCMGCVILEVVLQDRLFLFVFGGQDSMYEDIEHAYKKVYEARVARQIWKDFWGTGKRLKAIVLLATFDHYDLQRLLIDHLDDGSDLELCMSSTLDTIVESETESKPASFQAPPEGSTTTSRESSSLNALSRGRELTSPPRELTGRESTGGGGGVLQWPFSEEVPLMSARSSVSSSPMPSLKLALQDEEKASEDDSLRREGTADSARSFTSSRGMEFITRFLKDHLSWRET